MVTRRDEIIGKVLDEVGVGMPIISEDDERIGSVKDIEGNFIKVDAFMSRDYWLHGDYAVRVSDGAVHMSFPKRELAAYKMNSPELAVEEAEQLEPPEGAVIGEDDQLQTRINMERELAEQRRELPHVNPEGEEAPPDTFGTVGEPVEAELERVTGEPGMPEPEGDAALAESQAEVREEAFGQTDVEVATATADASFERTGPVTARPDEEAFGQIETAPPPVLSPNGSYDSTGSTFDNTAASSWVRPGEYDTDLSEQRSGARPLVIGAVVTIVGLGVAAYFLRRRRRKPAYERALTSNRIWRFIEGSASKARRQAEQIV